MAGSHQEKWPKSDPKPRGQASRRSRPLGARLGMAVCLQLSLHLKRDPDPVDPGASRLDSGMGQKIQTPGYAFFVRRSWEFDTSSAPLAACPLHLRPQNQKPKITNQHKSGFSRIFRGSCRPDFDTCQSLGYPEAPVVWPHRRQPKSL